MRQLSSLPVVIVIAFVFTGPSVNICPASIFSDGFEGGLSDWVGKGGGSHNGVIVPDPIRPGNHALTFTAFDLAGNIFATAGGFELTVGQTYRLSLEYLGYPRAGSVPDDFGGFAGMSNDLPGTHVWLFGTLATYGLSVQGTPVTHLIDDGQWRGYEYSFVWQRFTDRRIEWESGGFPVWGSSGFPNDLVHVMLEDYATSGEVTQDVYFDNVRLEAVIPEPSTLIIWSLLGTLGIGLGWWRKRKAA